MPKKSFYLFLTSLLGVMLFLIFHRVAVFFYLYLLAGGYITSSLGYYQFLALDYLSLTIALMLGAWYGIWLGLYWFDRVYGAEGRGGFVDHLARRIFSWDKDEKLQAKMDVIKERLREDVWKLEDLAQTSAIFPAPEQATTVRIEIAPVKAKAARKRAPRKSNTSNIRKKASQRISTELTNS